VRNSEDLDREPEGILSKRRMRPSQGVVVARLPLAHWNLSYGYIGAHDPMEFGYPSRRGYMHIHGCRKRSVSRFAALSTAAACSVATISSSAGANAAESNPGVTTQGIKIGVVESLSGAGSAISASQVEGLRAGIAAINAHGGVNHRKIQLVFADNASSMSQDFTATESLVRKGVFAVIYGQGGQAQGSSAFLYENNVPVIATADNAVFGNRPYTNVFTTQGSVDSNTNDVSTTIGTMLHSESAVTLRDQTL